MLMEPIAGGATNMEKKYKSLSYSQSITSAEREHATQSGVGMQEREGLSGMSVSSDLLGEVTEGRSQVRHNRCHGEKGRKSRRAPHVQETDCMSKGTGAAQQK